MRRTAWEIATVTAAVLAVAVHGQSLLALEQLLERLAAMPKAVHQSEVRIDPDRTTGGARIWIDANEDDMRLWSLRGGQTEMDFQTWFTMPRPARGVQPGRAATPPLPDSVHFVFSTRGGLQPGPPPHDLLLVADGRPLSFAARTGQPARSGRLLFLEIAADLPFREFLTLVTATRVEGRVFGHPFALLPSQLELLRAYAWTGLTEGGIP